MKILFINKFVYPDYQCDMVYHGLIDLGHEVYETSYPSYMLELGSEELVKRKFSLYNKLSHIPKLESEITIKEKIRDRFYDIIIFGSVQRDLTYFDIVKDHYIRDEIYFIDGEDGPEIIEELINKGIYYKRECIDSRTKPISFAIPESQLLIEKVSKSKTFGTVIPGRLNTYVFNTESEYYYDYSISYYGFTYKKGGWDCMRHYEILANRCVPFFVDLEECPKKTLHVFPKEVILEMNKYAMQNEIHPNYDLLSVELFDYVKRNLTTRALIKRII